MTPKTRRGSLRLPMLVFVGLLAPTLVALALPRVGPSQAAPRVQVHGQGIRQPTPGVGSRRKLPPVGHAATGLAARSDRAAIEELAGPAGDVIWEDPFSHPSSGWPVLEDQYVLAEYLAGEYHVLVKQDGATYFLNLQSPKLDGNFAVQETARTQGTTDRSYAVIFGGQGDLFGGPGDLEFYSFEVDPVSHEFAFFHETATASVSLVDFTWSGAIHGPSEPNTLRVEREGTAVRLLVNGALVATVPLASVPVSHAGLFTINYGATAPAHFYFDDFRLERIGPTPTTDPNATPAAIFSDDFSNPATGWGVLRAEKRVVEYLDGEYHIWQGATGQILRSLHGPHFAERFDLSADARSAGGAPTDGSYGLAFGRYDSESSYDYYFFNLRPGERAYALGRYKPGEESQIVTWTESSAIRIGGATNRLRVVSISGKLDLYVNDTFLTTVPETAPARLNVGFAVGNHDALNGTHGYFDNIVLRDPNDIRSTATPTRGATWTPIPTRTPTVRSTPASPTPSFDEVTYQDDFSKPDSGWLTSSEPEARREYLSGEYHFLMRTTNSRSMALNGPRRNVFDARVEARAKGATQKLGYGLIVAARGSRDCYVLFVHPTEGMYSILRKDRDGLRFLVNATASTAVHRGEARNVLRITSDGQRLTFYVNDEFLTSLPASVGRGQFGLEVWNVDEPAGTDVYFDNIRVTVPRGSEPTAAPTAPGPATALPPDVLYADDFSDPRTGWNQWDLAESLGEYADGEFRVLLRAPSGQVPYSAFQGKGLRRFEVEVAARAWQPTGPLEYGLAFGGTEDYARIYEFEVDPVSGRFALLELVYARDPQERPLVDWTESPAIRRLGATNLLRAVGLDDQITLFVNGTRLGSWPLATDLGLSGLTAAPIDADLDADMYFDNFVIRRPGADIVPSPEASPTVIVAPTRRPSPTARARARIVSVYLPLALQAASPSEMAPPPPSHRQLSIEFGVSVNEAGELQRPGTVFEYGIQSLVARMSYHEFLPGTALRWRWQHDGRWIELPGPDGQRTVAQPDGVIDTTLVGAGGQPLPAGEYRLALSEGANGPLLLAAAAQVAAGATVPTPTTTPAVRSVRSRFVRPNKQGDGR